MFFLLKFTSIILEITASNLFLSKGIWEIKKKNFFSLIFQFKIFYNQFRGKFFVFCILNLSQLKS